MRRITDSVFNTIIEIKNRGTEPIDIGRLIDTSSNDREITITKLDATVAARSGLSLHYVGCGSIINTGVRLIVTNITPNKIRIACNNCNCERVLYGLAICYLECMIKYTYNTNDKRRVIKVKATNVFTHNVTNDDQGLTTTDKTHVAFIVSDKTTTGHDTCHYTVIPIVHDVVDNGCCGGC